MDKEELKTLLGDHKEINIEPAGANKVCRIAWSDKDNAFFYSIGKRFPLTKPPHSYIEWRFISQPFSTVDEVITEVDVIIAS